MTLKSEYRLKMKKIRRKIRRKSLYKIYLSNGEFKHTNDKVIITMYIYNRQRINLLIKIKKLYKKILRRRNILKRIYLINKALLKLSKHKQKKYLKKIALSKRFFLRLNNPLKKKTNKRINKKLLKRFRYCFLFKQLIYINTLKFNNFYLDGLTNIIKDIYLKNVELNLINLNSLFLNSDILIQPLTYKLRKKRKLYRYLKRFMKKIKVEPVKIIDQTKYFFDKNLLFYGEEELFNYLLSDNKKNYNNIKRTIFNNIKYKKLTGIRISAAGRLTRYYKASRAKYKIKYKGNLKNIYASKKHYPYVLLRSKLQPNLDYNRLSYKTRIGSFGIKG
jgi:hypothetical protein